MANPSPDPRLAPWPPLAGIAFDRAGQHRDDPDWLAAAWATGRVVAISPGSATPVTGPDGAAVAFRSSGDYPDGVPRRFLGLADGVPYFTVTGEPDSPHWLTLRDIGATAGDLALSLVATAIGLEQWHQRHPCCPRCGAPTEETQAGWTRTCTAEGSEHFPRTDPAVIMLVGDGDDRVLLGRGRPWPAGRFSTLAGFVEPGESLEAAVAREVYEEVGVVIEDIRYVASQPWPFPSSLMLGFWARLRGASALQVDPAEMAEADWFTRPEVQRAALRTDTGEPADASAKLQAVSPKLSISRYLIDAWLAGGLH